VAIAQHRVPAEFRQVIDSVLAANARSELILEGLLTLAHCENQVAEWLPVDLSDVAAGAVEETAGEAAAAGVTIDADPCPALTAGDPTLLERLALNLVRNGAQHNHRGGWVMVTTRTAATPGLVELEVSNSGPHVRPEHVDSLFDPFRRLGEAGPPIRTAPGSACPSSGLSSRRMAGNSLRPPATAAASPSWSNCWKRGCPSPGKTSRT
jgi:signal transduction histidine kinase